MPKTVRWCLAIGVALALAASFALAAFGLNDRLAPADAILVPGNTVNPDGSLSARLRARLDAARQAFATGCCSVIIVSGGIGSEQHDEAAAMQRYLIEQGVHPSAIICDREGVTTAASARNARRLLARIDRPRLVVASQFFHVARTSLLLERQGMAVVGHVHPDYFELRDAYSLLREIPAIIVASLPG